VELIIKKRIKKKNKEERKKRIKKRGKQRRKRKRKVEGIISIRSTMYPLIPPAGVLLLLLVSSK
jgi:hypothetical protein